MGYQYQGNVREPANPNKITKNVVEFGHASGYKYGSNFFATDLYLSDGNDPANNGGGGAHEAYVVYRHNLSLSAVSGSKLAFGPVRDVSLMTGFNWSTKNDAFASRVRELMIGPTFHIDVNGGFWDLGPTKTEVHFFPKLVMDVGRFAVEYWRNKYGSSNPVGVNHTTPTLLLEVHF